jgi:hypothetical protein
LKRCRTSQHATVTGSLAGLNSRQLCHTRFASGVEPRQSSATPARNETAHYLSEPRRRSCTAAASGASGRSPGPWAPSRHRSTSEYQAARGPRAPCTPNRVRGGLRQAHAARDAREEVGMRVAQHRADDLLRSLQVGGHYGLRRAHSLSRRRRGASRLGAPRLRAELRPVLTACSRVSPARGRVAMRRR